MWRMLLDVVMHCGAASWLLGTFSAPVMVGLLFLACSLLSAWSGVFDYLPQKFQQVLLIHTGPQHNRLALLMGLCFFTLMSWIWNWLEGEISLLSTGLVWLAAQGSIFAAIRAGIRLRQHCEKWMSFLIITLLLCMGINLGRLVV